jgi:glycerol-3-phosphate dehydrogenase
MNRHKQIAELVGQQNNIWDIIIIGGGATGLGIVLDAVSRGYKALLLEKNDFAEGTSSRSTKLVHGGVRYLAQGDLLLVTEAVRERGYILRNAPHLATNQEFVIPVYGYFDALMYTAGLKFYDLLAGRLSLGKSYFIGREKTIGRLPTINKNGLVGGIVYHDGRFDDARLAIELADESVSKGATVLNYFGVTGMVKDQAGGIKGVTAKDSVSGTEYSFNARVVINATGVFTDDIHRMDDPASVPSIRPSQGVHLVLDNSFLGSESALMIPKTSDGRVLFAIPWYGKVVVGTTDTPINDICLEPVALEKEINFILETAGGCLTKKPSRGDILCVFAGLRPLASNPENPESTREISRRHKIILSESGLISIIGGKWTTYRCMAEETIDRAIRKGLLEKKKCVTRGLRINSENGNDNRGRFQIYGKHAASLQMIVKETPSLGEPIDPRLAYSKAEVIWICRNEMAVRLSDVLARRTRSLFLDVKTSLDIAPEVASIMAKEMGFDKKWEEEQLADFKKLAANYL